SVWVGGPSLRLPAAFGVKVTPVSRPPRRLGRTWRGWVAGAVLGLAAGSLCAQDFPPIGAYGLVKARDFLQSASTTLATYPDDPFSAWAYVLPLDAGSITNATVWSALLQPPQRLDYDWAVNQWIWALDFPAQPDLDAIVPNGSYTLHADFPDGSSFDA